MDWNIRRRIQMDWNVRRRMQMDQMDSMDYSYGEKVDVDGNILGGQGGWDRLRMDGSTKTG